jgi:hypothetical protein
MVVESQNVGLVKLGHELVKGAAELGLVGNAAGEKAFNGRTRKGRPEATHNEERKDQDKRHSVKSSWSAVERVREKCGRVAALAG